MPEYLSPGVYVEEIDTGNKPIEGVPTSTVGFLGVAERGAVEPTLITSFSEFVRKFGSYVQVNNQDFFLAYGVEGFFQNGGKRCFIQRVVSGDPATQASSADFDGMRVTAIGPGTWGDRIAVKISDASLNDPAFFKLTVMYYRELPPLPLVDPTDPANNGNPNRRDPTALEVFDNLSGDPGRTSFYVRQLTDRSDMVRVDQTAAGRPANAGPTFLQNGNDGAALALIDFQGDPNAPPNQQRGLLALEGVDEIALLCCPDEHTFNNTTISDALVGQCERLKDRFAILQAPQNAPAIANHRPSVNSKYGAYYYPWMVVRNPINGREVEVPPGGHVAGIYNRSDTEEGVHKAPANEVIRGIVRLQLQLAKGQQDVLNPRGVNVLRYFAGRGNLVWGARTTTLDPDWKYVNVRRLFIFAEESIEEGMDWVVFENNHEPLWARVRRSVGDFLTRLWKDGMLVGATPEEAYFVKCDRTTMTQADIDTGRLICIIGMAPVKPAEFVIFRIGQWTGGSEVAEL